MNKHVSKAVVTYVLLLSSFTLGALRIATYNINSGGIRTGLDTVLQGIGEDSRNGIARPVDILLLQEQSSSSVQNVRDLLNTIYTGNPDVWYESAGLIGSGSGGLPAMIYNSLTVNFLDQTVAVNPSGDGAARSTIRYRFIPLGYSSADAQFYIYNSHYKASNSSSDRNRREQEASEIRDHADAMGDGKNIVFAGDFNLYTSSEGAWTELTAPGNAQAFDPVNSVGSWHDNSAYRLVHTQAPATNPPAPLVNGGMDDRFDFQLLTHELLDGDGVGYIANSYRALANNGTHSLNGNITSGTGSTAAVRAALMTASDHLPVIVDYQLPSVMDVQIQPLSAPAVLNENFQIQLTVTNVAQAEVPAAADELVYGIESDFVQSESNDPCSTDWTGLDIGSPTLPGSFNYIPATGQLIISGNGQITNIDEQMHYVYDTLSGDGELIYKLDGMSASSSGAAAGLMIREGLSVGDRYGYIHVHNSGNILWRYRFITGWNTTATTGPAHAGWRFLKIARSGDELAGYESTDGENWNLVGTGTLSGLAANLYIGFAVASGDDTTYCQATFSPDGSTGSGGTYVAEPLQVGNDHFLTVGSQPVGYQDAIITVTASSQGTENGYFTDTVSYRFTNQDDFDGDGDFDLADLNLMLAAMGTTQGLYDLDSSGTVTQQDMDILVDTVLDIDYGDLNLDRSVDWQDAHIFLTNWLYDVAQWQHGEMTGDGIVDQQDWARFSQSWLSTSGAW